MCSGCSGCGGCSASVVVEGATIGERTLAAGCSSLKVPPTATCATDRSVSFPHCGRARGGGSLTILGLLEQAPPPGTLRPEARSAGRAERASPSAAAAAVAIRTYGLDEFAARPAKVRTRIEAIAARGVAIDDGVLAKLGIAPPVETAPESTGAAGAASGVAGAEELVPAREAYRRSVGHTDQLTSLADGHLLLQRALLERGRRPAMLPTDSLARVGAGSEASQQRAQPATPAMTRVAQHLRLELAQAADLLPPDASDCATVRQQRTRAAAFDSLLWHQPPASPIRLSHQLVLLHALAAGHLDHLAGASVTATSVHEAVEALLGHTDRRIAPLLQQIDATGELAEEDERRLLECAAEVLPPATGRAFFTNLNW